MVSLLRVLLLEKETHRWVRDLTGRQTDNQMLEAARSACFLPKTLVAPSCSCPISRSQRLVAQVNHRVRSQLLTPFP